MIDWPNMTFEERSEAAKRDDILDNLVPSDIRVLLSSIAFLKKQNENLGIKLQENQNLISRIWENSVSLNELWRIENPEERALCMEDSEKLSEWATAKIKNLQKHNAKLDRFTRMMMKVLEEIEECQGVPDQITDAVADILADWSEE